MSIYYYLACKECKIQYPLVGMWVGGTRYMIGSEDIPEYWHKHIGHLDQLTICSEHDELHDELPGSDDDWEERPDKGKHCGYCHQPIKDHGIRSPVHRLWGVIIRASKDAVKAWRKM